MGAVTMIIMSLGALRAIEISLPALLRDGRGERFRWRRDTFQRLKDPPPFPLAHSIFVMFVTLDLDPR